MLLELADPADADERVGAVETEATLRAGRGREEAELLVEVDGADGLAGLPRQVADLHQVATLAGVVERAHAPSLGIRWYSADLSFAVGAVDALEQGESVVIGHSQTLTLQSYVRVRVT